MSLASVRDAISYFRFETVDSAGNPNPLAAGEGNNRKSGIARSYIYGVSQSGRFIVHMLWQGFHVDEKERMIVDGMHIHVAGGGKGGFNYRFAQTTHHPSHLEGNYMPADHMPFNYLPDNDPGSGGENDVLARAKKLGKIPYILITNNTLEYWTRSASLIHTDPDRTRDSAVHPKVRIYMTNGAPHRGIRSRDRGVFEHSLNPISVSPVLRATLTNLDKWISEGIIPPDSRYPGIGRGQLVSSEAHRDNFPKIPGMRHPGTNLQPPRVDYGERFWSEGIFTVVPPKMGEPYITGVPNYDEDGNDVGGITLPELAAPLGTYQAWNPRQEQYGAPNFLGRFEGSFWPFAGTKKERKKTGDPRLSIEERYTGKEGYLEKVKTAVTSLVRDRFLLPEDAERYMDRAQQLSWPPEIIERSPFWKIR